MNKSPFNPKLVKKSLNKKSIKASKKRSFLDIRNYKILCKMEGEFENNLSVKFIFSNEACTVTKLNDAFFKDENGKTITEAEMMFKLNTIKHDYNAEKFIINKI